MGCRKESGVMVGFYPQPDCLDSIDIQFMLAADKGGQKVVISSDAHRVEELGFMRYGIDQARRAWLKPKNVLNTLPPDSFLSSFKEKN
jgi:DNA polymerase (family 10)